MLLSLCKLPVLKQLEKLRDGGAEIAKQSGLVNFEIGFRTCRRFNHARTGLKPYPYAFSTQL